MNPPIEPDRPESRRRWPVVLVTLVMGAAALAVVAHLTSPSVVAGERNAASVAITSPVATSDQDLFRHEVDASFDPIVLSRLADTDEFDTRGASIAAYDR